MVPVLLLAGIGVGDETAQVVEVLAQVELASDAPAEGLLREPAQRVQGAHQLAVLEEGLGQGMLARSGLQAGDQQRGGDVAEDE